MLLYRRAANTCSYLRCAGCGDDGAALFETLVSPETNDIQGHF